MNYLFELPIGDYFQQGHSESMGFIIESNKDVQTCRELYFATKERLKIGLDERLDRFYEDAPCSNFKEKTITIDQIKKLGLDPINYKRWLETGEASAENFAFLFIDFMTTHNPELELKVVNRPLIPTFVFYGEDQHKRRIGNMGYGLLDNDLSFLEWESDKNKKKGM